MSLERLRPLSDEIIVAVDSRVDPQDLALYAGIADRLFRFEFEGFIERFLPWLHAQCNGDWILRLDGDEVVGERLLDRIDQLISMRDVVQNWLPRRLLFPDREHWLQEWPWWPDYQLRLFRNDPQLWTPGICHTSVTRTWPERFVRDAPLYHLEAVTLTLDERRAKLERYIEIDESLTTDTSESFLAPFKLPELYARTAAVDVPDGDAVVIAAALEGPTFLGPGGPPLDVRLVTRSEIDSVWPERALDPEAYRGTVRLLEAPTTLRAGERACFRLAVRNDGSDVWPGGLGRRPHIRIGCRWLGDEGSAMPSGDGRADLPGPLSPRMECIVPMTVVAPGSPGRYVLELDLVHELVRWFDRPTRARVLVVGAGG